MKLTSTSLRECFILLKIRLRKRLWKADEAPAVLLPGPFLHGRFSNADEGLLDMGIHC